MLARNVERNEVLKSSDVVVERRPKAEVGTDAAGRDRAVGMQARRQLRAGQALRVADLAKPDLVQRDQNVTLIYETPGLYLTVRGKALESGTEGDVVNVMNLQSKRTVSGTVTGRGQVSISVATPRPAAPVLDTTSSLGAAEPAAPVSVANSVRQSLQKPSNVNVSLPYQPLHSHRRIAGGGRNRQRLLLDRPSLADRRKAEADGDRESDHAARLQAGADADAETGTGFL